MTRRPATWSCLEKPKDKVSRKKQAILRVSGKNTHYLVITFCNNRICLRRQLLLYLLGQPARQALLGQNPRKALTSSETNTKRLRSCQAVRSRQEKAEESTE